ncbi:unnamed protein product, partial [Ectocarpus sp. 12 AP-2014]
RHPAPETVNRVFSAAVGSEVKTAAAEVRSIPYQGIDHGANDYPKMPATCFALRTD